MASRALGIVETPKSVGTDTSNLMRPTPTPVPMPTAQGPQTLGGQTIINGNTSATAAMGDGDGTNRNMYLMIGAGVIVLYLLLGNR